MISATMSGLLDAKENFDIEQYIVYGGG